MCVSDSKPCVCVKVYHGIVCIQPLLLLLLVLLRRRKRKSHCSRKALHSLILGHAIITRRAIVGYGEWVSGWVSEYDGDILQVPLLW